MMRGLRVIGLSVVAGLVLGACLAPAASAEAFNFKSEKAPTTITGSQHAGTHVFTTDPGVVQCVGAKFTSQLKVAEQLEMTLVPTYSGCTAFGFIVPITLNGCHYLLTADTLEEGSYEGRIDLVCPAGGRIEWKVPGCTVTFPGQTELGSVTFTNKGSGTGREITVDVDVTGFAYEEHKTGIFPVPCAESTKLKFNGTWQFSATLKGEGPSNEPIGVWVG